ncbi:hypothetical protein HSR121_1399 [Halapricum desulfuricans]|uniref:Uncharacterized protein n=1 Tax=Halapricum desulfuricans TaxID=2841257 RepID=A0A897MYL7_9EURY|nr:hypothetical protein HSR121_1399 [Halapricum desulfuricans]
MWKISDGQSPEAILTNRTADACVQAVRDDCPGAVRIPRFL